ncbi:hypothetical protein [Bacillus kexueae]|uniref:hypothetical protein n=1 Tax=Aeribacillus kexueae TaxID=2078952 RepID=UPI001FAF236D|nr:hypothetical protein [Bacillus kexueae]
MKKKSVFFLFIISGVFTLLTPFMFKTQFMSPPVHKEAYFGAPIPFFYSPFDFPQDQGQYPLVVPFELSEATFSFVPFLFSFLSFFLFFLALYYIIARFFRFGGYIQKKSNE